MWGRMEGEYFFTFEKTTIVNTFGYSPGMQGDCEASFFKYLFIYFFKKWRKIQKKNEMNTYNIKYHQICRCVILISPLNYVPPPHNLRWKAKIRVNKISRDFWSNRQLSLNVSLVMEVSMSLLHFVYIPTSPFESWLIKFNEICRNGYCQYQT